MPRTVVLATAVLLCAPALASCTTTATGSTDAGSTGQFASTGSGGPLAAAAPVEVPLDGGSYTWPSGITMKIAIDRVEPWGTLNDYCGDGSCGVSHPDDTRLVLRYTISVPASFREELDTTSCPGDLHVLNGNDEDALNSVAGDYHKTVDSVRPGATKYGTLEYAIAKASAEEKFYVTSDCGSVFPMSDAEFAALTDDEQAQELSSFESQPQEATFIGGLSIPPSTGNAP